MQTFTGVGFLVCATDETSLKVALRSPERSEWFSAINKYFDIFICTGNWKTAKVPSVKRGFPSGVILRLERDSTRRPARFKARLVARGNLHLAVVDYTELYAPVVCIELVRHFCPSRSQRAQSSTRSTSRLPSCMPPCTMPTIYAFASPPWVVFRPPEVGL